MTRIDTDRLMTRLHQDRRLLDRIEAREQEYRQMAAVIERSRSEAATKEQQAELARRTRR